ncbi:MAG: Elongation factor Ts [Patescibacteria group bacterium]|jgi:hypothetical protein|nr:Elongation factor Ts [Patescibacteria group bacterium]
MKNKNIGKTDRVIRALLSFVLIWQGIETSNIVILIIAGILLFTAVFSWCGLYTLLGINTCKACKVEDKKVD